MGKNSENSNEKEKDLASDFSNRRSSKFDELTGNSGQRPNSPRQAGMDPKERAKKIWKWVSVVIYLFLFGLGITGFIQSCVLKTSSTVGAGVELYNDKNIAPYVTTYQIVEKQVEEIEYDNNGVPLLDQNGNIRKKIVTYYSVEQRPKENYLTNVQTIQDIREQLRALYGEEVSNLYGAYDNYSSTIRIIGLDNTTLENTSNSSLSGTAASDDLLKGDKGNFIFINNKILDYLNTNSIAYKNQLNLSEINLFVRKRPKNWNSLSNTQKDYYGIGITQLSDSFIAYEYTGSNSNPTDDDAGWKKIETINGKYVTKDVNGDGIIDSSTYVEITDQNRINKFKYSLDAEIATLSTDDVSTGKLLNSEGFSRDYIQALMNIVIRFPQMNDFYSLVTGLDTTGQNGLQNKNNPAEIFSNLTKQKLEQTILTANKKFTLKQKNAILKYQNEIQSTLTKAGYGIRQQVYSDETSDYYEPTPTKPFEIIFLPAKKNKANIIVGTGSAAQKPITSWGESWRLGPFYGLVVYPLSYIIGGMMGSMPSMSGWDGIIAIVIAILLTRVIVTLFTYKSLFSAHKQQQLNPKKAKIDAKYEPFKGNREMEQRKRQEIAKLYKANNVSMMQPLKAMCISMPIFFAVWRVVQGIAEIKATTWLGVQFSLTSWRELFAGAWQYLPLLIFAALTQVVSQLLPRYLNRKRMNERANKAEQAALKKANKTQNIMMIVFVVMAVIFEAGVQIYWIVSGLWQIAQVLVIHHIVKSNWYRTKGHKYV